MKERHGVQKICTSEFLFFIFVYVLPYFSLRAVSLVLLPGYNLKPIVKDMHKCRGSAASLNFPLFSQGPKGHQREEYNVCSADTAFQCSSYQKLITIIQKSPRTLPSWLDTMITNQVLLLLMLSVLWPSSALPFTPGNIGNLFGLPESDGRILQRSKRGWMWNQFFLLEEYAGNDHQYVGKVTCPNTLSAD